MKILYNHVTLIYIMYTGKKYDFMSSCLQHGLAVLTLT